MSKNSEEYDRFNYLMHKIIAVPHSEIKSALDAEKLAKKRKKSRKSSSASRVAGVED